MVGGSHNYQKTELIALSEDGPVPGCLSNLKDHPNKVYLAAGGALTDRGELVLILDTPVRRHGIIGGFWLMGPVQQFATA